LKGSAKVLLFDECYNTFSISGMICLINGIICPINGLGFYRLQSKIIIITNRMIPIKELIDRRQPLNIKLLLRGSNAFVIICKRFLYSLSLEVVM
jgi:hypothetical protein